MIVEKPWGRVVTYALNQPSSVRVITVEPGQETSVHYHRMRDETWVVLDPGLTVEIDDRAVDAELPPEKAFEVPRDGIPHFFQPHAFLPRGRRVLIAIAPDVLASEVGPEVVMLSLRDGTYYGLDGVGVGRVERYGGVPPYAETRGYVPIILRNYWVYEQKEGKISSSREALVQGLWPKFPGARGAADC